MEIVVAAISLAIGIGIGRWTKRGSPHIGRGDPEAA
jgi:hypothetical protein